MKLYVDGYEITITAKKDGRTRKEATSEVLTHLACMGWDAMHHMETEGYNATANAMKNWALAFSDAGDELN